MEFITEKNKIPLFIFFFFFAVYVMVMSGRIYTPDEAERFAVIRSLSSGKGFIINENEYSKYGPLLPILTLPLYALGEKTALAGFFSSLMINPVLTALCCALFFIILREMFGLKIPLFSVFLLGFGSTMFSASRTLLSETLTALAVLSAFYFAFKFAKTKRNLNAFFSGLCLGAAALERITAAVIIPVFFMYIFFSAEKKRRACFFFIAAVTVCFLLIGSYNIARYGELLKTGYEKENELFGRLGFSSPLLITLPSFFFSAGKGLFIHNPFLILALAVFPAFLKSFKKEARLILFSAFFYIPLHALWVAWHGGAVFGPRLAVPILPLLYIPAAFLFQFYIKKKKTAAVIWAIFIISVLTQVPGTFFNYTGFYLYNAAPGFLNEPSILFSARYMPQFLFFRVLKGDEPRLLFDLYAFSLARPLKEGLIQDLTVIFSFLIGIAIFFKKNKYPN